MAVPSVTLDTPKPSRLGNSVMGVLSGSVNVSSYDTSHPAVSAITGLFIGSGLLRVTPNGLSSSGYLIRWDKASNSFKAYVPGATTLTPAAAGAASAVTVGSSPFTYTSAAAWGEEILLDANGATSTFIVSRGGYSTGARTLTSLNGQSVVLFSGDTLALTYTVATPIMEKLPFAIPAAAEAAAEVEAANAANLGTFDFIAVGQIF